MTRTDSLWSKTVLSSMSNPPWNPWSLGTSFSSVPYDGFIKEPNVLLDDGSVLNVETYDFSETKPLNSEIAITTEMPTGFKLYDKETMLLFDVSVGIGTRHPIFCIKPICFLPKIPRIYKLSMFIEEMGVEYFWMLDVMKHTRELIFPMRSIPQPPPGHWVIQLIFKLE